MAKELPYFQFEPAHYLTGSIQFCSLAAQGLFINLISIYWQRECQLTLQQAKKRFNNPELLEELHREAIIKLDGDNIIIQFLIDQYNDVLETTKRNVQNGKKGAKKRWEIIAPPSFGHKPTDGETIAIREDKIKEDKIKEDKGKVTHPLCLWILNTLPNVSKLRNQLTDSEAEGLIKKFDKPIIREVLEAMENKSDLVKKYRSVNLTVQNWIKLRKSKNPDKPIDPPKKTDYSQQDDFYAAYQNLKAV